MKEVVAGCLLAVAVLVAEPVQAQQLEQWGEAGGWDVMVDPTLGNGCLIQAEYDDGSVVRIGFDRITGNGYVTAFNDAWGAIEEGKEYDILFDLDGDTYQGVAHGIYLNGVPGADITFDNPEFLFAIAEKYTMTLHTESGAVMQIDLGGTYVGLEAAIACQDEQG